MDGVCENGRRIEKYGIVCQKSGDIVASDI